MRWLVLLGLSLGACYVTADSPPMGVGTMLVIMVGSWLWQRHTLEQAAIRRELEALRSRGEQ